MGMAVCLLLYVGSTTACCRRTVDTESRYDQPKTFFSVVAVDQEIYAIGGMLAAPIDSVEAYMPKTNNRNLWLK